jgi:D-3-phosphoglycerate dehydrogenase
VKAFITAEIWDEALGELGDMMTCSFGGYGATRKLLEPEEMLCQAKDADILIIEYEQIDRQVIEGCRSLQIIACCRGSPVNVDVGCASEHLIPVITARGRNAVAVAEFTFGLLLAACRSISLSHSLLKSGNLSPKSGVGMAKNDAIWIGQDSPFEKYRGTELKDKTLGVVGFGVVGGKVAEIGKCFGMQVLVSDPFVKPEEITGKDFRYVSLNELLRESDFVSLHCKASKDTEGLIGGTELELMKQSAYLINTARGSIVNEDDLYEALKRKRIAGAALDVFKSEPVDPANKLLTLDNVVATPHIAGATTDLSKHFSRSVVKDLKRVLEGRRPLNIANPEVLEAYWKSGRGTSG